MAQVNLNKTQLLTILLIGLMASVALVQVEGCHISREGARATVMRMYALYPDLRQEINNAYTTTTTQDPNNNRNRGN